MSTRNIQEDMNTLRGLIPQLRERKIYAIEFGDPKMPKGFMSHHRIRSIATHGGEQICFKIISRGMEAGGHYMGNPTDREIEIHAQGLLDRYFAPTPFSAQLEKLRSTRSNLPSDRLCYFAVEQED